MAHDLELADNETGPGLQVSRDLASKISFTSRIRFAPDVYPH